MIEDIAPDGTADEVLHFRMSEEQGPIAGALLGILEGWQYQPGEERFERLMRIVDSVMPLVMAAVKPQGDAPAAAEPPTFFRRPGPPAPQPTAAQMRQIAKTLIEQAEAKEKAEAAAAGEAPPAPATPASPQ